MTDLLLRAATRADAEALWTLRTRAIETSCAACYPADDVARWAAVPRPPRFGEVLEMQRALVAEIAVEGTPSGGAAERVAVGFGFLDRDDGQISAVYVSPDRERRGVGRAILSALERDARAAGLGALHLASSLNAVEFYRAAGYAELSRSSFRHPEGFDLACVRMEKRL